MILREAPSPTLIRAEPHRTPVGLTILAALSMAAVSGFARVSLGLLLPAIKHDFPGSYFTYGWVASANFFGYLVGNALLPLLLARSRNRLLLNTLSILLMGATLIASGTAGSLAALIVIRAINGVAQAAVLVLTVSFTLERVAPRARGRVSGVIWMGAGLGIAAAGAIAPLALGAPLMSWREQFFLMGLVTIGIGPAFSALARRAPLHADGPAALDTIALAPFVTLCVAYALFGGGFVVFFTYFTAFAGSIGVFAAHIGIAWAVAGLVGAFGGSFWGVMLDRAGTRRIAWIPLFLAAAGCGLLAVHARLIALVALTLICSSTFGFAALTSALAKRYAPGARFALAFTIATIAFALGQVPAGPAGGFLSDRAGLGSAMLLAAAFYAAAALIAIFLPPHPVGSAAASTVPALHSQTRSAER